MKTKVLTLALILVLSTAAFAEQDILIPSFLIGMRNNFNHRRLPLGDINRDGIGNASKGNRLIFSEAISYYLFSNVLPITGEDEEKSKRNFLRVWNWAKANMVRKNLKKVFIWSTQSWGDLPEYLKDNLLAWRYVIGINGIEGQDGVIYTEQDDPDTGIWHDGSQAATDGDLLIAYALHIGFQRWGEDFLLEDAKNIVKDIRKKCIIDFKAGELYNAHFLRKPYNMYQGSFVDEGDKGNIKILYDNTEAIGWQGKHNYLGFWHDPLIDLTNLDRIEVVMKGSVGENTVVDIRLQDTEAVPGDENQPGQVYYSSPIELTAPVQTVIIEKEDFRKSQDYGTKEGDLNWSGIKNIQFQVWKDLGYYQYKGTYHHYVNGHQDMLNIDGVIAWEGNRNFVGFSYKELVDLSDLKEIRITLKGHGWVSLRLEDGIPENPDATGNIYITKSMINLTSDFRTLPFTKNDFKSFPYYGLRGPINWDRIRKVQFQVDDTPSRVELKSIVIELNNGKTYIINDGTVKSSTVYVKSLKVILNKGQTDENNGYKLLSNGHGALYINPSYFMPFAYRVFAEIDPEGEEVWKAMIKATYDELMKSLNVTLHDLDGNPVTGNGHLVPNWYMLDKVTGQRVDVATQKPNSKVRGFESGYDAFRTIWFTAFDYALYQEPTSKKFLESVYPFYRNKLDTRNEFYPVFRIDGTQSKEHQYKAGAGFLAVYLNLFNHGTVEDNERRDKIISLLSAMRDYADDGRTWFRDPNDESIGETEYFMNFWTFFGLYLDNPPKVLIQLK